MQEQADAANARAAAAEAAAAAMEQDLAASHRRIKVGLQCSRAALCSPAVALSCTFMLGAVDS
jgi:hypothetical protein